MKLSVKKLRRTATVIGGSFLGLGIAAALATPALACVPSFQPTKVCANADGSWVVNWTVSPSDGNNINGRVTSVTVSAGTLTGIHGDNGDQHDGSPMPAEGVQTLPKDVNEAYINVNAVFTLSRGDIFSSQKSQVVSKPTQLCEDQPNPHPSTSHSSPAKPSKEPDFVYSEDCTTLTVGVEVPKTWKEAVTVTFTPSVGTPKTVTAQPGETKTVDFKASKGLTVKATPKGYPESEASSITYKAPKNCASPAPSTTNVNNAGGLPVTGSSSGPIAAGAVALVLLGGGAFFLSRRRKMKFTA